MFNFLFQSQEKKKEKSNFIQVSTPKKDMFLVLHKTTREPIGIFDSLDKAKEFGRKSTYCTCSVYKFILNDKCKYLNSSVYED